MKNRGCREDSNSQLNRPTNSNACSMIIPQTVTDGNGIVKKEECEEQLPGNSNYCRFCEVFSFFFVQIFS